MYKVSTSMRNNAPVKGGAKCSCSDGFNDDDVLTVEQCIEQDNSQTLLDASNRSEEPNEQSLSSPVKQTGDEQSRVLTLIQLGQLAAVPRPTLDEISHKIVAILGDLWGSLGIFGDFWGFLGIPEG